MNQTTYTLPPSDDGSERALLASMLRDNRIIPDVVMLTSTREFYKVGHQVIFSAIVDLADKRHPADIVTVAKLLMDRGEIAEAGGATYLAGLFESAPSAAHYMAYAASIRESWTRRRLIAWAAETELRAFDLGTPASESLESTEQSLLEIAEIGAGGESVTLHGALTEEMDRLTHRRDNPRGTGVPTGFADLDGLLCGLQKSELIVLAARPSVGKSQLALSIAINASADYQFPVLFTSLEQSRIELAERLISTRARIDSHTLRRGQLDANDIERMMQANDGMSNAKLFFDDTPGQGMTRIAANARRMQRKHDIGLIVVDYLQLITPEDTRAPRNEQLGGISRRLKMLARELKIPVLALAQLNRESEAGAGSRPKLSQLGGSDNIGQDADTVILLHRQNENTSDPVCLIDVIIEKNRNGRRGEFPLAFEKRFMTFHNYSQGEPV